jgi:tetratricopeptide (TPR) repeat protein
VSRARLILVVAVIVGVAAPAAGDDDADRFSRAARQRGTGDLAGAADAFERLADERPTSPWADDARMEAALAAEALGQYERARRDLDRLLADHPDSRLVRRAEARRARIIASIGERGEWAALAVQHEAIVREAGGDGDPAPAYRRLEALLAQHPGYARAYDARMWLGDGWLRQGQWEQALASYRRAAAAAPDDRARFRAGKAIGDALVTHGELDDAAAAYRALQGQPGADAAILYDAFESLAQAQRRAQLAWAARAALALLVVAALALLRRDAGSWRGAGRALVRPPVEVGYLVPVAIALVLAGLAGNQIAARAVQWIVGSGVAIAWLSGASLRAARERGRLGPGRVLGHVAAAIVAVAAVAYLALMRDRLLDMLVETWRHGHELP